MQELDQDEMEAVNGGAENKSECSIAWDVAAQDEKGHNNWCLTLWHCGLITCHTETNSQKVYCYSDYKCHSYYADTPRMSS